MSKPYTPPVITVSHDLDEGVYVLYASSYGHTAPAGPRLFRASPWPEISFSHFTEAAAERDAEFLRAYLDACASGKVKEKEGAVTRRGWWMD